jgi:hypothetical protein
VFREWRESGIDRAILSFDDEQLFAFHVVDLGPIDRLRAQNVVDADEQRIGIETFDLAGDAVTISHDDDVAFVARKQGRSKKQRAPQNHGSGFHSRILLLGGNHSPESSPSGQVGFFHIRTGKSRDCVRFETQAARHGRGTADEAAQTSRFWGGFRHDVAGSGGQAGTFQLHGGVLDAELCRYLTLDRLDDLLAFVHVHVGNARVAAEGVVASTERPDVHIVDFDNLFQGRIARATSSTFISRGLPSNKMCADSRRIPMDE